MKMSLIRSNFQETSGFLKKRFFLLFLFSLCLFLSYFSGAAIGDSSGCFLYPESPRYCSDLSPEEAQVEISDCGGCSLPQYFFSGKSCQDKTWFSQCRKVICKSSCQEEFLGLCSAGEIPEGEEIEWCLGGICAFSTFSNDYCAYKSSKWLCEVEAKNKGATAFGFNTSVDEAGSTGFCAEKKSTKSKTTDGFVLEKVSNPPQVKSAPLTFSGASGKEPKSSVEPDSEKIVASADDVSGGWIILILFALVIFIAGMVYWYLQEKKRKVLVHLPPPLERKVSQISTQKPLSLIFLNRNPHLREKAKHQLRVKKREELLLEKGLLPNKAKYTEISRLKRMVRAYEHQLSFFGRKKKETEKLAQLVDKLKRDDYAPGTAVKKAATTGRLRRGSLSRIEEKEVISKLRFLAGRK